MGLDQFADDGQAQAKTLASVRQCMVLLQEQVEDVGRRRGGDAVVADARVALPSLHRVVVRL